MRSSLPEIPEPRGQRLSDPRVSRPDAGPSERQLLSQGLRTAIDLATIVGCYLVAFVLRFDGHVPWPMLKMALLTAPYVVLVKYAWLSLFGVPQFAWRYVGLREALRILQASVLASTTLVAMRLAAPHLVSLHPLFVFAIVPRGVLAIDGLLALLSLTGVRTFRRWMVERRERSGRPAHVEGVRTLIVGAGSEGFALVRELDMHPELGVDPVGFVDRNHSKLGTRIHGIRVLGTTTDIPALCRRHDVQQAILALPASGGAEVRALLSAFDGVGIPVKILPAVASLVGRTAGVSLRDVSLEDLLRRPAVELADEPVESMIADASILVTGAGGSIGSELARQIASHHPRMLTLVERSEFALYEVERELRALFPALDLRPRIVDVCDAPRVREVFEETAPTIVLHAAAHKHVPMLEQNVGEAIKNNVGGTVVVAEACLATGVEALVLVSTDKAVNPSSVMGATKRAAELYVQALAKRTRLRGVAVRFGNVLGSSGSVVPLFREQIARGGPVTVTHPDMRRYFMTIPEACNLVLHTAALGQGAEIFILDMGEPVRIADLAEDLIRLSGLVPHRDVAIEFTGLRPGEKLFEELSVDAERADATRHPRIFVARARPDASLDIQAEVTRLVADAREGTGDASLIAGLRHLVPEYVPARPGHS